MITESLGLERHYTEHVADYAAWAAVRLSAPLELLHVIDRHPALQDDQDRSGALLANAEENLLKSLSEQDAVRTRAERENARAFLQALRERTLAAGASPVDTRQRHGDLQETLVEQQAGARLMVLGRRGASADQAKSDLGSNVEWTVRAIKRPILAVTDRFKAPERVLIAFDGSPITRKGVEMVAASALFKGLPVHVLMSDQPKSDTPKQLEWARQTLVQSGFEVVASTVPGEPETVIDQTVLKEGIDLLIMGAYTHSPLRKLFFGSKTDALLRGARVPTLLLR